MRLFLMILSFVCGFSFAYAKQVDVNCLPLVASYTGKYGETILIREHGDDRKVFFYYIEMTGFNAHESIYVYAIEGVLDSALRVKTNKKGKLYLTITPVHQKRTPIELDFGFHYRDRKISLGVSMVKYQESPLKQLTPEEMKALAEKEKKPA